MHTIRPISYSASDFDMGSTGVHGNIIGMGHYTRIGNWAVCLVLLFSFTYVTVLLVRAINTISIAVAVPGGVNTIVIVAGEFFAAAWWLHNHSCFASLLVTVVSTVLVSVTPPAHGYTSRVVTHKLVRRASVLSCTNTSNRSDSETFGLVDLCQ